MPEHFCFTYSDGVTCRLDVLVTNYLSAEPEYSFYTRSQVQKLIEQQAVSLNGVVCTKKSTLCLSGSAIEVRLPEPEPLVIEPWDVPLQIAYEDESLLVVNKGRGMTVHPGAGNPNRTLLNALAAYFGGPRFKGGVALGLAERYGIVHRLDKDTTGLLVVAKTQRALQGLTAQFGTGTIGRRYRALVFTTPRGRRAVQLKESGAVDAPIGRHPTRRTLMAVVTEGGRRAVTHWRRIEQFEYGALLELKLETGRTHQIRVHMAQIGSPVVGDQSYGNCSGLPKVLTQAAEKLGRQALHAYQLEFLHPESGKPITVQCELPTDFLEILETFRDYRER